MVFNRFIEVGRVVYLTNGKYSGKLATIVDIVDGNRALIDGPSSNVPRSLINFKDVQITKLMIPMRHGQRSGKIEKAWAAAEITKKWDESLWAKKIATKELRANMTDFDRFKLMKAKQMRNRLVRTEMAKLKKTQKPKTKTAKKSKK